MKNRPPPPREGVNWGRDSAGRLVGLSKADAPAKRAAGRKGKSKSHWRFGYDPELAARAAKRAATEKKGTKV